MSTSSPSSQAVSCSTQTMHADVVVIGAGPVGLFAVFQLGLLGIAAHVVDALPHPGGQPARLYPDKPIYDIPAVPVCTGQGLVDALLQQIAPFKPVWHLGQQISVVQRQPEGEPYAFLLCTHTGTRLLCKAIVIAAGVGAFVARTLKVPGLQAFAGTQVLTDVPQPEALAGRDVVVLGGGDSALDWALTLADGQQSLRARSVTLVHRRDGFRATSERVARMRDLCAAQRLRLMVGQVTGFDADTPVYTTQSNHSGEGYIDAPSLLRAVHVTGVDGQTQPVALDAMLVCFGRSPQLGPIADWGLAMQRRQLQVSTDTFQTSEADIFAIGDINTYPGKRKLIVCGFHEATLAAFAVADRLSLQQQPTLLQYTTTSPLLHQRLGVA